MKTVRKVPRDSFEVREVFSTVILESSSRFAQAEGASGRPYAFWAFVVL